MKFRYLIPILLILIITEASWTCSEGLYGTCNRPFSCGTLSGFQYPFRRHQDPVQCGFPGFELNCDQQNLPTININNIKYQILGMDPIAQTLKLVRADMLDSMCPQNLVNTTIDHTLFDYTTSYANISFLFGCPIAFDIVGMIGSLFCGGSGVSPVVLVPGALGPGICKTSVIIPIPLGLGFLNPTELVQVLREGFDVMWKIQSQPCTNCIQSGGMCVYDVIRRLPTCACPQPPFLGDSCSKGNKTEVRPTPSSSSRSPSLSSSSSPPSLSSSSSPPSLPSPGT